MKLLLLFCCFYTINIVWTRDKECWEQYKTKHKKKYASLQEEQHRMERFNENQNYIDEHNAKHTQGLVTYTLEMNRFGDQSVHELRTMLNGYNKMSTIPGVDIYTSPCEKERPEYVDWVLEGAVTPIKNQGACGSCYAFSAAASMESRHFLATGNLLNISVQNLMDCTKSFGNRGCSGGWMEPCFTYAMMSGSCLMECYPYVGKEGRCKVPASCERVRPKNVYRIPSGDLCSLQAAVAEGPVSVGIDASPQSFYFYKQGIYNDLACGNKTVNHGVVIVGFCPGYWKIRNSWGPNWGIGGYMHMLMDDSNMCGITNQSSFPTF